jgi:hypothetical protein
MAFSLACDAGKTTLRIEGTDSNVTWNDVANAGAGSVAVDGGGTEDPSFFVTEYVANGIYQVLKNIQFGDGTNILVFYSKKEVVRFDDDQTFTVKDNATLQLGEISGDYCINGACWSWEEAGNMIGDSSPNASCKVYGSTMHYRGTGQVNLVDGIVDFRNSQFHADDRANAKLVLYAGIDSLTLKNLYISNWAYWQMTKTPDVMEAAWLHYPTNGFRFFAADEISLDDCLVTDSTVSKVVLASPIYVQTVNFINPRWNLVQSDVSIIKVGSTLYWKYTCNIHVVDKDGNNLNGVAVTCEDKDGNQVFNVQTGANGKIVQQTIIYKKWVGPAETETEYSPHKFIFSKDGYTLLVMENVTVDAQINWDIKVKFPEHLRARMVNLGRLAILR